MRFHFIYLHKHMRDTGQSDNIHQETFMFSWNNVTGQSNKNH